MQDFLATPSRLLWSLLRFARRVWVRVTLISVLAVLAAGAAPLLQGLISEDFAHRIGADAVRPILNVLATSMLAVTTFSLSVMVAAHRAASDQVSPRTHRLLLADTTTQNVLATFLGAFLFSLVSIVLLNASVFDSRSIAIIFIVTLAVILLVVAAILRWIEHLSRLGSMLETTRAVERAAKTALAARRSAPWLGGRPAKQAPERLTHAVYPDSIGYVAHVDTPALRNLARERGCAVLIRALPGSFVAPGMPLAEISVPGCEAKVQQAFAVGDAREFDQDPRFGLIVLSEIASRALSPGVNDPGTAIDVIGRVLRLLCAWEAPKAAQDENGDERGGLFVPEIEPTDLVEDGFGAIARDGAVVLEVQLRLQKALVVLAGHDDPRLAAAARAMAGRAEAHASHAGMLEGDLARIAAVRPGPAGKGR